MSTLKCLYEDQIYNISEYVDEMKGSISCDFCKNNLIAKRGKIKIHHFSHRNDAKCDTWHDNKGEWHLNWQNIVKTDNIEIIINREGTKHIADIFNNNLVIEIQNSNISQKDIQNRENFYNNMIWIVNLCYMEKEIDDVDNKIKDYNEREVEIMSNGSTCIYIAGINFVILKTSKKYFTFMEKELYFDTSFGLFKKIICIRDNYYFCEKVNLKHFLNTKFDNILNDDIDKVIKKIQTYHSWEMQTKIGEFNINYEIIGDRIKLTGYDCKELVGSDFEYDIRTCNKRGSLRYFGFNYDKIMKGWIYTGIKDDSDDSNYSNEDNDTSNCGCGKNIIECLKRCNRCKFMQPTCNIVIGSIKNLCKGCDTELYNKTFLEVLYTEKEEIKKYGGRFDGIYKKWYISNDNKDIKVILEKWKECKI